MGDDGERPCIWVLAGTNGAGKSSIGGAAITAHGLHFFNPDEAARRLRAANPGLDAHKANSEAWEVGRGLLQRAIAQRKNYAFETTLGGATITGLLRQAAQAGLDVRIWYAGLDSPELHLARVQARVRKKGHDIGEDVIRARFDTSREHLIALLPHLAELYVYDNSRDRDPDDGLTPQPRLLLHCVGGRVVGPPDLAATPAWAKPIVAAALKLQR